MSLLADLNGAHMRKSRQHCFTGSSISVVREITDQVADIISCPDLRHLTDCRTLAIHLAFAASEIECQVSSSLVSSVGSNSAPNNAGTLAPIGPHQGGRWCAHRGPRHSRLPLFCRR